MLKAELGIEGKTFENLRILSVGTGNSILGNILLEEIGCNAFVGVDTIPGALQAALTGRLGTYGHYYLMYLSQPKAFEEMQLKARNFNVLITVRALGFKDILTRALINTFNLAEDDESGFRSLLDSIIGDSLWIKKYRIYPIYSCRLLC